MFAIAIPSYKRADQLNKKTLKALKDEGFLPTQITVFVANEDERRVYEAALDRSLYGSIVVGHLGLAAQRKFISEYYPLGHPILQIDDDIRRFKKLADYHLPTLFQQAFDYCIEHQIPLWGLYPTHSTLFMKKRFKIGCFYLVGSCFGLLNTRDVSYESFDPSGYLSCKEDYFRTFTLYKQAKKLFRIDSVSVDTTYWGGKGGLKLTRTLDFEKQACEALIELFPEYIKDMYLKKNGHYDIHLRKIPHFLLPPETLTETAGK